MAKEGEIRFLSSIGEQGLQHAIHKPFSDPQCNEYLADFSAITSLLPPLGSRILDLGCGTGWTSLFLGRMNYQVVGVDIATDMIEQANRIREVSRVPNVTFLVSDYEEMPFREEFDAALFFDSLHHAMDEGVALQAVYRALKPGGICVTREPGAGHSTAPDSIEAMKRFGITEKDMPPQRIITVGREAGFQRFQIFPLVHDNLLKNYRRTLTPQAEVNDPLAKAGWLKRMFHRLVRKRFNLSPAAYSSLLTQMPRLTAILEGANSEVSLKRSGIVVLEK